MSFPALPETLTGQGIGLRSEESSDHAFLRRLYGTQRAEDLLLTSWSEVDRAHFLDEQFRLQSLHFDREAKAERLIIERSAPPLGPEPIGRLYLDRSASAWRLLEIALLPALQGIGIGTSLIQWLHAAATAAGAEAVDLHVTIANGRAGALYRRLRYVEMPSDWPTHKRMRRALRD
ncbi:GNAT family N-acetyltransferase [Sphingomonas sp. DT-207]|uniref:GNAT family N-acetyltransferase n=1 Tax=Sphingomonas sp. DT-207 TaxID=3396167 RepID=UPI003F1D486A